jgi:mannonate dehydratase
MKQTWRWFGPNDKVTLSDVRQAGASGIVSALYDVRPGTVWTRAAIATRKAEIVASDLTWDVVESLPVSEAIRTNAPEAQDHIQNWITSLENLAAEGLEVICYNFMPVLDWTRTDLAAPMASGARALRFDLVDFVVFDCHVLGRKDAALDYPDQVLAAAQTRAQTLTDQDRQHLTDTVLAGLPGAVEHWTLDSFRDRLAMYAEIDADGLRANLAAFLKQVVPHAERLGLRLCCHPDDPPWPLFGLPRIMSTEANYQWLVDVAPSLANGITFCTGSLGARGDNDLPGMMRRLGDKVHFLHLRNVQREDDTVPGSFHEAEHLSGSTDMVAVMKAVVAEERRRLAAGRADASIPLRPDHGQDILDDQTRKAAPGYPAIGRLKGLAELRGVMLALEHST